MNTAKVDDKRIASLDFLRGIAILGILIINIESFAYENPWSHYKYGFESAVDVTTRFWVYFLAQGKFWGMLSILFGIGFYIFIERLERKGYGLQAADLFAKRLLWLFVIGVIHAYLIWDGDILYHYAICGFVLFAFRSLPTKQLLFLLLIPILMLMNQSFDRTSKNQQRYNEYVLLLAKPQSTLTEEESATIRRWQRRYSEKQYTFVQGESARTSYWQNIQENAGNTKVHRGEVFYKSIFFRTLILMAIGIILYRQGIFSDYRNFKYYWPFTLCFLAAALAINFQRYHHWTYTNHEPVISVLKGWMHLFPRELLAVAYVLTLNGLYQLILAGRVRWIENVGKLALSNYILQSVICGVIFYGYGFGLFNQIPRSELLPIVASIWLLTLALSAFWLKYIGQGPLEKLWRKLTYSGLNLTPKVTEDTQTITDTSK